MSINGEYGKERKWKRKIDADEKNYIKKRKESKKKGGIETPFKDTHLLATEILGKTRERRE